MHGFEVFRRRLSSIKKEQLLLQQCNHSTLLISSRHCGFDYDGDEYNHDHNQYHSFFLNYQCLKKVEIPTKR